MTKRQDEINSSLDEIEAAYLIMAKKRIDAKTLSNCKAWVRKHKAILKGMKYKGKIPRQPKIMKKNIKEKDLFSEEEDEGIYDASREGNV